MFVKNNFKKKQIQYGTDKGKAFPLQAWTGPWGSQEVEGPEFLDI
jgi:hypothetical protein